MAATAAIQEVDTEVDTAATTDGEAEGQDGEAQAGATGTPDPRTPAFTPSTHSAVCLTSLAKIKYHN